LGEDDDQGRDTLTYVKPERDIFKAIFESDDEEDGDQDQDQDQGREEDGTPDGGMNAFPGALAPSSVSVPAPTLLVGSVAQNGQVQVDSGVQQQTTKATGHLSAGNSTAATYVPASSEVKSVGQLSVDMSTFRPTFNANSKSKDAESKKERKEKKSREKDRRKGKAILSFEEEGEGLTLPDKPKKKKEKKDRGMTKKKEAIPIIPMEGEVAGDEDDMWIERPPAQAVQTPRPPDAMQVDEEKDPSQILGEKKGERRMRAVDFL